jgi:hypothetical protein
MCLLEKKNVGENQSDQENQDAEFTQARCEFSILVLLIIQIIFANSTKKDQNNHREKYCVIWR